MLPPGARPLVRVQDPKAPGGLASKAPGKLALFAASQGDEISGPAPGENQGLFTKVLTEALGTGAADADGDGQISLQELSDWVKPRVAREARRDSRDQNPVLTVGSALGDLKTVSVGWGYRTR